MKVCSTVKQFIEEYSVWCSFFRDIIFEDESMYKELFDYCMDNQSDPLCALIIGNLYKYLTGVSFKVTVTSNV